MRNIPLRHRTRLHRSSAGFAALALGSVLTLAACSSGGSDKGKVASLESGKKPTNSTAEAAAGEKGDMVKYAGCMREHGVDMPDPGPDGGMAAQALPAGGDEMAKMQKASEACRKWLPNGGVISEKEKAAAREDQLKLAKCLREHGLNVPDPGPDGEMSIDMGNDSAKSEKAFEACTREGTGNAVTVPR